MKDPYEEYDPELEMEEAEKETESMLRLIQDFKRLREQGTAGLSDEERRKNAEQLILQLGKYMDMGSDEEDGEEVY